MAHYRARTAPRFGVPGLAGGIALRWNRMGLSVARRIRFAMSSADRAAPHQRPHLWLSLPIALALVGFEPQIVQAQPQLSAQEVIQKAVARTQQAEDRSSRPAYTYTKLTVTEELDAEGNVKTRKE